MKDELVVKSNALIQASYSLSIAEQKIILSAITEVRRDRPITDEVLYSVTANALTDMTGFTSKHEYRSLKDAAKRLWNREVKIYERPNGDGRFDTALITRWVQSIKYLDSEGAVEFRFGKDVLPYLNQLNSHFTEYKLKNVSAMKSSYGIRLYELLMQWLKNGEREIAINNLREMLCILEHQYKQIHNLKARVIVPAITDVNNHSNLWVKVDQRKTGRRVTHFLFKFGLKESTKKIGNTEKLTDEYIKQHARPGESWEVARNRLGDIENQTRPA